MTVPAWITVSIVACAINAGDNNIPRSQREGVAHIEAEAFIAAVQTHVSLETLLAVGHTESRFNPTGSQRDRDNGVWGVMQILDRSLSCWRTERIVVRNGRHRPRVRYVRHDDETRCTPEQLVARARMMDPAQNIAMGARLLTRRYDQIHAQRHDADVYRDWIGSYFFGSAPPPHGHRRAWRTVRAYASRVHRAEAMMHRRLQQCRPHEGVE